MERSVSDLKDGWRFALGPERPAQEAFHSVHIPHDWAVARPVSQAAPLSMAQGYFHRKEIGWYHQ